MEVTTNDFTQDIFDQIAQCEYPLTVENLDLFIFFMEQKGVQFPSNSLLWEGKKDGIMILDNGCALRFQVYLEVLEQPSSFSLLIGSSKVEMFSTMSKAIEYCLGVGGDERKFPEDG